MKMINNSKYGSVFLFIHFLRPFGELQAYISEKRFFKNKFAYSMKKLMLKESFHRSFLKIELLKSLKHKISRSFQLSVCITSLGTIPSLTSNQRHKKIRTIIIIESELI